MEHLVKRSASQVGLHDPRSPSRGDHFTPNLFRKWFTTALRESGMPWEYVKHLRGDALRDEVELYIHPTAEKVRHSYREHMPRLGV